MFRIYDGDYKLTDCSCRLNMLCMSCFPLPSLQGDYSIIQVHDYVPCFETNFKIMFLETKNLQKDTLTDTVYLIHWSGLSFNTIKHNEING